MSTYLPGGRSHLSLRVKFGYGVGHVFNDLVSSMWFTYLLLYLQYVLKLDKALSGILLMVGLLVDSFATPIIAIWNDKGETLNCFHYGRRKSWHLIGTICVAISFPFMFIKCASCLSYMTSYMVFMGFMMCVFQLGWTSVQVSHLSLIPDLTPNEQDRDELNIIRYTADATSDVFVYLLMWFIFSTNSDSSDVIDASDAQKFQMVALIVLGVGIFFSILFHAITPEVSRVWQPKQRTPVEEATHRDTDGEEDHIYDADAADSFAEAEDLSFRVSMRWKDWLMEPQFYLVATVYASARLANNLAYIYTPIFLQATQHANQRLTVLIPLVMSLSGIASTIVLRLIGKGFGKKNSMGIAICLGVVACGVASYKELSDWAIVALALMLGICVSSMVILALTFAADLIGYCTDSSAFVYGSMSSLEKLLNGLFLFIIQELASSQCEGDDCSRYYRLILSIGMLCPLIIGMAATCSLATVSLGKTNKITKAMNTQFNMAAYQSTDSSDVTLANTLKFGYGSINR